GGALRTGGPHRRGVPHRGHGAEGAVTAGAGTAEARMPARDTYHDAVRNALLKDGWTITHDPFRLKYGQKDLYVDLGAQRLLAAEKGTIRLAVEIKSFVGRSEMDDLEHAVGQYNIYRDVLQEVEAGRALYMAIPAEVYKDIFLEPFGKLIIAKQN